MEGFAQLVREILLERGLDDAHVHWQSSLQLPGYFRATKDWDLFVVADGRLLLAIEFKSQVGSFGNNFNNRTEEAIGSAVDLRAAYRAGAFKTFPAPWLGWLMLLEESKESTAPVRVQEPHFAIFAEFKGASYTKRYELLCKRLVKEGLYDSACLLLSRREGGRQGTYGEPSEDVGFQAFAASLSAQADSFVRAHR